MDALMNLFAQLFTLGLIGGFVYILLYAVAVILCVVLAVVFVKWLVKQFTD